MNINPIQRQSLLTLGSLVSVTIIGYIATIYFAHYLGPAPLGAFYLFLAYYGIFDLIGDGGFGGAAVKRISEGKEQNQFFTAYVILRVILLCISIVIFVIIYPFLPGIQTNELFYWLIIALIIGTIFSVIGTEVYATAQVGVLQVSSFVNTTLKIIFQILAVFVGWGVGGLAAGFIAGMVAATVINFKFLRLSFSRFNRLHLQQLFSFSLWTFLSSGGSLIFSYADTILIGFFMTESDVGIYRVAFQLASVSSLIVLTFHTVLFPRISKWHAENNISHIELSLSKAVTYCLVFIIPITIGGTLLSKNLMYYLYGASFESGANVLIILFFVQIANIFMYLFTMCLNAINKPRESFIVTSVSAGLNIIFNIVLIPVFGIIGAAAATLLSMSINTILAQIVLRPVVKFKPELKAVYHIMVSSAIMAFVVMAYVYYFPILSFISLFTIITLGAIVYFAVLLVLDSDINCEVKNLLKNIMAF
jgi:O-antigen/teichoic acid export membrane protein